MSANDDKFYHAQITQRVDFAPDLWMFRMCSGGDFTFVPGQYATLGVEDGGKRVERPYSIVSAPSEGEIEFFFELVPEGALTPRLHKMQVGDQLLMRKVPKGRFSLETGTGRTNHLLVSTVTGVAPFVSFVRTMYKDWKEGKFDGAHKLYLLNGASRPWEFGYLEELPGANTQGRTLGEAREKLREAARLIIEANRELARRETAGRPVVREELLVTVG